MWEVWSVVVSGYCLPFAKISEVNESKGESTKQRGAMYRCVCSECDMCVQTCVKG